jgi:hypothetical protein
MVGVINKLIIVFGLARRVLTTVVRSASTMGVHHICLPPFGAHQSVPLVLGRFARVVFLDADSAIGGSSRSSASLFWISLFHDICLLRMFSSLPEAN